ncbi:MULTISPECIES: hypothetical protein [Bacillus]|uniref:hypothetical protein n=1 Tax=Bacillus TaxID=1386 RepID=UPI000BB70C83|nr:MULTISPECIES: hypothetical protein [Bacillus]
MSKDKVIGWFMLWGLILLFELIWLYAQSANTYNYGALIFIVTLIFVTVSVGAVGLTILIKFSKSDIDDKEESG